MKSSSKIRIENILYIRSMYSTDAEFAEAAGLAPSFFGQIKRGERNVGEKLARKIEDALGLRVGALDRDGILGDILDAITPGQQARERATIVPNF